MKNSNTLLEDLLNGTYATTRPTADYNDNYVAPRFTADYHYSDKDYEDDFNFINFVEEERKKEEYYERYFNELLEEQEYEFEAQVEEERRKEEYYERYSNELLEEQEYEFEAQVEEERRKEEYYERYSNELLEQQEYEFEAQVEEQEEEEYYERYSNELLEEQEYEFEAQVEEQEEEEPVWYDRDTDTYKYSSNTYKYRFNMLEQIQRSRDINYAYIEKVKNRYSSPLSEIVQELDSVYKNLPDNYTICLKCSNFDIDGSFKVILDIINKKKECDYYKIYKAKDTLKKIEEMLSQFLKENDFNEIYYLMEIRDNNIRDGWFRDGWFEEEDDILDRFWSDVAQLIEEIFYIISLLDNSSKYKIKRKKLSYRKIGFKKKSSKYFKLLSEGYNLEDISKLCDVNIESLKRFFKRKLKEYKLSINDDDEIMYKWTINKDELDFFRIFMIKSEPK